MTTPPGNPEPQSAPGDFYVEQECCISCGVPQMIAPDLVGWTSKEICYWIKQPHTPDELDRAIQVIHTQDVGCHRYAGSDKTILKKLPREDCDYFRPELKFSSVRALASSAPAPTFSLATSAHTGLFTKLWRSLFRK
jgi:hypothetical protein